MFESDQIQKKCSGVLGVVPHLLYALPSQGIIPSTFQGRGLRREKVRRALSGLGWKSYTKGDIGVTWVGGSHLLPLPRGL